MRIVYAKFVGFIGFYNGLGLSELEIDFSKSKNHITVISGPNGCGKSTLLNALNLLPDNSSSFVPAMRAYKNLRIDDGGTIYDIFFNYPVDKKGKRAQTKISIKKNGVELNPNGNVRSYEEIIYNEFNLDDDYVTLSHLSGTDRGLADKKPGERKKFINSINSSMDVYNSIHKNLNKKANTLNGYIKNLSNKIQNIGDENVLRSEIVSINNRYNRTKQDIESIKSDIIEAKTLLAVNDPDGKMQEKYQSITDQYNDIKNHYDRSSQNFYDCLNSYKRSFKDFEYNENTINTDIANQITINEDFINTHKETLNEKKSQLMVVINSIQSIDESLETIKVKIDKLDSEINTELDSQLDKANSRIDEIVSEFSQIGIGDINNISSSEVESAINIMNNCVDGVDLIYDNIDEAWLENFITVYRTGVYKELDRLKDQSTDYDKEIGEYKDKIKSDQEILDKLSILDKRPEACKIDNCPFVIDSVSIVKEDPNIINRLNSEIEDLQNQITNTELSKFKNEKTIEIYKSYVSMSTVLDKLRAEISSNLNLLKKISISVDIIDFDRFLDNIAKGYRFNNIRDIRKYLYIANDITEYKSLVNIKNNLESEQKINKYNIDTYNEYKAQQDKYNSNREDLYKQKSQLDSDINFEQGLIDNKNKKLIALNNLQRYYNLYIGDKKEFEDINKQLEDIKTQFKSSGEILDKINRLSDIIVNKERELEPLEQEKKQKDAQIILLNEYQKEYADYKNRYDIIDKLKKYSSPVDGGIQTLFMSLYMSKTLTLANQLLSMIFGGQYKLLDYVINENEFRMPFIGNGLPVDDISDGSTSQVCIMGMIINLVLLHQASDKYNIVSLDEIDGGLDAQNRYMYIDVLQRVIQILNIDQLFIISHNIESNLNNIDLIQLAPIDGYEDAFNNADVNIIYSYKNRIN